MRVFSTASRRSTSSFSDRLADRLWFSVSARPISEAYLEVQAGPRRALRRRLAHAQRREQVDVRLTLPLARARLFRVDAPLSRGVAGARTWARRAPTRRALARCVPAAAPRASRLAPLVCTCGVFERRFAEVALNLLARVPLFPDARRSAPKPPRRALPPPLHHRRIPPCGGRGGPPPAPMRRPRCATPAASCACPSPPPGSRRRATFPSQPPRFGSVSSAFSGRLTSFLLKAETASPIRVG